MTSVTIGTSHQHVEDVDVVGRRWRTGVLLLIVADASFVAALLFSYLYLRGLNTEQAWLAHGQHTAAIWLSWVIAVVLALSAVLYRWGQRGIQAGNETRFLSGSSLALLVLVVDAVIQVIQLAGFNFEVSTSAYSSAIYTLAGANLFHLVLTVFLGIAIVNRGRAHLYTKASNWQVQLVGMWWVWIAAAAIVSALATSFIASPNTGH